MLPTKEQLKSIAGYPHWTSMVQGLPLTGRSIPPQIGLSWKGITPPMNFNVVEFQTFQWPIDKARNWFAEKAIEMNAKYLWMMGEDVQIPPFALRELIFLMEHHPDVAVAGGIYCLKLDPPDHPQPLVFKGPGQGCYWDWKVGEIFEVDGIGMDCTLIRTEVFKDLEPPYFQTINDMSPFLDNIPKGDVWTEDLFFCNKVTKTEKWKIMAAGHILCKHYNLNTGKVYELPGDSKPMNRLVNDKSKPPKKIIDLGCGENPLETDEGTVVTVDIRESVNPQYRCDLRKLPFATDEFDIVYSSHTLEHFPRADVDLCLDEWTRILKPDGELRLVIPNIAWAAEKIVQGIVDNDVLNVLYGSQEYRENFHRVGFTPEVLMNLLKARGLEAEHEEIGYNIMLRAHYPKEVPENAETEEETKTVEGSDSTLSVNENKNDME